MTATANYAITHLVEGSGQQAVPVSTAFDLIDKALASYLQKSVAGGVNVTLTATEWQNKSFEFNGTLTGNIAVIVPTTPRVFVVYNNTSGSFSLTVRTSAGSGVVITQGDRVILLADGTDVRAVTIVSSILTELAQDAVGYIFNATLVYDDGTPAIGRAAITGDVTVSAGSNAAVIADGVVTEAKQVLADNTTHDVSTSQHGYVPKAPNNAAQFLNGVGAFAVPTTGQGKHSIWIPAAGMTASVTLGAIPNTIEMSTNKNTHKTLTFADSGAKVYAEFDVAFPKKWDKGTLTFSVFWTLNSTLTAPALFGLQGVAISDNDALDVAFGMPQEVVDNGLGTSTYKQHVSAESPAITIAGTPADEDLVNFRFYRDSGSGSDTLGASVELLGIKLYYTTNANTDA